MIELLVGMIASGKSTYARKRADEGALVVSHDALTEMLHARYRYEQGLRDLYRRMEESVARWSLFEGRDVIVDRTHLSLESRQRWLKFRRDHCFGLEVPIATVPVIAVVFPVESPEVHARRRFESDARGRSFDEWLMVATHHYEQWRKDPISQEEGFTEIRRRVYRIE